MCGCIVQRQKQRPRGLTTLLPAEHSNIKPCCHYSIVSLPSRIIPPHLHTKNPQAHIHPPLALFRRQKTKTKLGSSSTPDKPREEMPPSYVQNSSKKTNNETADPWPSPSHITHTYTHKKKPSVKNKMEIVFPPTTHSPSTKRSPQR